MADAARMERVVARQPAEALAEGEVLMADGALPVALGHRREERPVALAAREAAEEESKSDPWSE